MKIQQMVQNLWDTVKAILRRKYIAIQAYLKKQEEAQITIYLTPKGTRKSKTKPKVSRRKEKIRAEINDTET